MVYALHANRIMPQHYIWYECACKVGYASETETKPKHHRKYSCRSIYFGVDDVPCWVATVSVEIESYLTHRYFSYICNCSCSECTACQSSDTKFLARFISFAFFILVFLAYEYFWHSFFICLIGRCVHKYCIKSTRTFIIWFCLLIYCHNFFPCYLVRCSFIRYNNSIFLSSVYHLVSIQFCSFFSLIYIIFIRFVAFYSLFSLSTIIIIIIIIIIRCWFTSA